MVNCPTPEKSTYPTYADAESGIRSVHLYIKSAQRKRVNPLEPYRCPCGQYHLRTPLPRDPKRRTKPRGKVNWKLAYT